MTETPRGQKTHEAKRDRAQRRLDKLTSAVTDAQAELAANERSLREVIVRANVALDAQADQERRVQEELAKLDVEKSEYPNPDADDAVYDDGDRRERTDDGSLAYNH